MQQIYFQNSTKTIYDDMTHSTFGGVTRRPLGSVVLLAAAASCRVFIASFTCPRDRLNLILSGSHLNSSNFLCNLSKIYTIIFINMSKLNFQQMQIPRNATRMR